MNKLFRGLLFLTALLPFSASSAPSAPQAAFAFGDQFGLSPYLDWKTLETEHFRITFPVELTATAQKVANLYEEAHAILHPVLYWEASYKVQVVLVDNADLANGLTSAELRFGMLLYVTPPDNWFSTAYYDDWLRLLVIHEYTHFLNTDATTDMWRFLRYAIGDTFLPNAIWPSWMLEGLAVYMETRFTKAGRGRSPLYDMILRSAVDDGVLDTTDFITLDKINGPNPYYPGGETPYLFGYELLNRVAASGGNPLGTMSITSAGRVPFFINSNLVNITGKNFYSFWDEWVDATKKRANEQLAKFRSQPLTPVEPLTQGGYETLGSAASPDGKWLAYTQNTLDRRMGLYLRDLQSGETRRVDDKARGAHMDFTPDSRFLLFSAIRVGPTYYSWSELGAYDLEQDRILWLTDKGRARDPNISRGGKTVAFTVTDDATTSLAVAPLTEEDGELRLGAIQKLFVPPKFDRISSPKFSADGGKIYFTWHRNGRLGEDLAQFELATGQATVLLADGNLNRYPAVAEDGALYFVSDRSGVDNVYRWDGQSKAPALITNVTTGLAFPTFARGAEAGRFFYASHFRTKGWDLARMQVPATPVPPVAVTVAKREGVAGGESFPLVPAPVEKEYPVEDYSVYPSILPRQWFPLLSYDARGFTIGGQVAGADAVDRHRYVFLAAYDTAISVPDWAGIYQNRSFGPTLSLGAQYYTSNVYSTRPFLDYERKLELSLGASYEFEWTYFSLRPFISANAERRYEFIPNAGPGGQDLAFQSRLIPNLDAGITFANPVYSGLAIWPEGGRRTTASSRVYFDNGNQIWKGYLANSEYFRVIGHSVFVPTVQYSWTSRLYERYAPANVVIEGKRPRAVQPLGSDPLENMVLRGYPDSVFYGRYAGIASGDFFIPLSRIYRGAGTNPAFLQDFYGFVFAEAAYLPDSLYGISTLPSVGAGLTLRTRLFLVVPVNVTIEVDRGLRTEMGGKTQAALLLGLGAFDF